MAHVFIVNSDVERSVTTRNMICHNVEEVWIRTKEWNTLYNPQLLYG
jgi:hypothetical protein